MTIRDLFTLRPSPVRWPGALQAAIAIGLPVIVGAIAGRTDLGLLASSGAFLTLYLGHRSRRARARLLPLVAVGLLLASATGILSSGSPLTGTIAVGLVAIVATAVCLGFSVGPPGSLFFVLVAGFSSHLAAPTSAGGAGLDALLLLGLLALGCLLAYVIVMVPLLVPRIRRMDAARPRSPVGFGFERIEWVILLRVGVGVVLACVIAYPLGVHRSYWVIVAVIAILQNGHRLRLTALRGAHRVLGTILGVGVFALLSLVHPTGVLLGLVLAALQFVVELLVIRNYGLALVFITPLALTMAAQGNTGDLTADVTERVLDTLLGGGIALAVLLGTLLVRWLGGDRWREAAAD